MNNTCLGWSSWSNFVSDENYEIRGYTSPYYAARMINLEWVQHRSGVHQMFPSSTDIKNPDGNLLVTTYAVHRPDGNWSLMLVNRDENNSHTVRVSFENAKEKRHSFLSGNISWMSFGSDQYVWINDGPNSHPDPTFLPPPQSSPPTRKPFSRCPKPPSPSSADDWQTRRKNYRPPHPHLRPHLCNSVASNVGRSFAKISSADSGRCTSFLKPGILSAFHISRDDAERPRRPAFFRDAFSPWRLTPNTDGIQPGVNGPRFRV